jgi:hypothetical protein
MVSSSWWNDIWWLLVKWERGPCKWHLVALGEMGKGTLQMTFGGSWWNGKGDPWVCLKVCKVWSFQLFEELVPVSTSWGRDVMSHMSVCMSVWCACAGVMWCPTCQYACQCDVLAREWCDVPHVSMRGPVDWWHLVALGEMGKGTLQMTFGGSWWNGKGDPWNLEFIVCRAQVYSLSSSCICAYWCLEFIVCRAQVYSLSSSCICACLLVPGVYSLSSSSL